MAQPMMPAPPPAGPPGNTAPATVAPNSEGLRMRGVILANAGLKFLEQALPMLGAKSQEGQAVAKAVAALGHTFAGASGDVTRQEAKMLHESAGPVQPPNPQQMSQFRRMAQSRLGTMPGAGTPSGGSPTPEPAMAGAGATP